MSRSNFRINKICKHCNKLFEAQKVTTQFCSDRCAKMNYKLRKRTEQVNNSNSKEVQTQNVQQYYENKSEMMQLNKKEFLKVKELVQLLGCSKHTVYKMIKDKRINAVNLSKRITLIKRSEIDKIFE
jgi:DNA binding domain, excisionase family